MFALPLPPALVLVASIGSTTVIGSMLVTSIRMGRSTCAPHKKTAQDHTFVVHTALDKKPSVHAYLRDAQSWTSTSTLTWHGTWNET